jgi:hypothetical protein
MQPDAAEGGCVSLVAGYTRDGWPGLSAGQDGRRGMVAGRSAGISRLRNTGGAGPADPMGKMLFNILATFA